MNENVLDQRLKESAVDERMAERVNIVFAGCSVLKGSGEAVIFATGLRTEFGKLAHLSQTIQRSPSPLERETGRMVRVLTVIAVSMGFSFFLYGVFSGRSLWVNLVFMMGIIVANVPEGLLPTFTLSLAIGSLPSVPLKSANWKRDFREILSMSRSRIPIQTKAGILLILKEPFLCL